MVIVSAGRRIDASGALEQRFPAWAEPMVAHDIEDTLGEMSGSVLISSAACGSDILALEAARRLGIRRQVVLPFDRITFRAKSVTDREGDWGGRYDLLLDEIERAGDLLTLGLDAAANEAYLATNARMLKEAQEFAGQRGEQTGALLVWNGKSRGPGDVTEQFRMAAEDKRFLIREISTLPLEIHWCEDADAAESLSKFFTAHVDTTYISHGEMQLGRAVDRGHWSPHLAGIVADEIREAAVNTEPHGRRVVTARNGSGLVALAIVSFESGYAVLEDLVIARPFRRRGAGEAVLRWIETQAAARNCSRIYLESGAGNDEAHAFFKRQGYEPCSVVMAKDIKRRPQ
jgi:GNAT superfamily N-acetyltransferase